MIKIQCFGTVSTGLLALALGFSLWGCRSPDQGAGKIGPVKKWGVSVGDRVHSTPTVAPNGNVYVGSSDHHLYAFNAKGRFLWKYKVDGMVKVLSPAVAPDGSLAFATSDGQLYLLDEDGRLRWKHQPRKHLAGCAPVITQGLVLTSGDLVLVSYRLSDGKAVPLGKKLPPVKGCISLGPQGRLYYASTKKLHAWSLQNNKLQAVWQREFAHPWSLPGFDKAGDLYLGTEDGRVIALHRDGKLKWTFQAPKLDKEKGLYGIKGVFARPTISPKKQVLVVRYGEGLYALSMKGKKLWLFPEGERPFNGYINVANDGMIFAGSFDYHMYAITPAGQRHYRFFTNDRVHFGVALSPDQSTLYFGSDDKHLYALRTHKKPGKK